MNAKSLRWTPALGLVLLGLLLTAALPDARYTSATSFKISGFLGKLIAKATPDEILQEVFVSGNVMLTRDKNTGTRISLDDETIATINYKDKSYTVMTFEQLRDLLRQRTAGADPAEPESDEPPDANVTLNFSLDRTGTFDNVNGYRAERVVLTILADVEKNQADAGEGESITEDGGQFVLVMELWMTDEADGYREVQDFQDRYAQQLGAAMFDEGERQGLLEVLKNIVGNDPRLKASLERAQEEAAGLDGIAVRTTTYFVSVPPGLEYDAELVFGEKKEEKKKKGGLGGFAKKLAQQAAGVGGGDEDKPAEQRTHVTTVTNLDGFSTEPISTASMALPSEFTRKEYVPPQTGN